MANQRTTINIEQRPEGEVAVLTIPRDVMEFCLTHTGRLMVRPEGARSVFIQDSTGERELAWAEVGTGDNTPSPGLESLDAGRSARLDSVGAEGLEPPTVGL